jgi:hypothetical protein
MCKAKTKANAKTLRPKASKKNFKADTFFSNQTFWATNITHANAHTLLDNLA